MAKKVTITWVDPSPTTNVDHLEIWRKTGIGGTYAQIGTDISLAAANSYEDTNSGAGLTDGTTYYYQVRAYAADGTTYEEVEGNITISATSTSLFMDDFTGTTIDTAKWTVKNPNPTLITITQNDALILTQLSEGAVAANQANGADSTANYDATGLLVLKFDANIVGSVSQTGIISYFNIGLGDGTFNNLIVLDRVSNNSTAQIRVNKATVEIGKQTLTGNIPLWGSTSWKITKAANGNVNIYHWSGSAWTSVCTTIATTFTTGTLKVVTSLNDTQNSGNYITLNIDNLYLTNVDFTTLNPA